MSCSIIFRQAFPLVKANIFFQMLTLEEQVNLHFLRMLAQFREEKQVEVSEGQQRN